MKSMMLLLDMHLITISELFKNKVRIKVVLVQLTLFVNTFVAFKKCIIQYFSIIPA